MTGTTVMCDALAQESTRDAERSVRNEAHMLRKEMHGTCQVLQILLMAPVHLEDHFNCGHEMSTFPWKRISLCHRRWV